jgi:hypothetical protein
MSRPHEQKYLLHNRSNCRHCDCPQSPRLVLGISFAGLANCAGQTIFVADAHRDDRKRFVVRREEKLTAFLELEKVTRESLRFQNAE